MCVDGTHAFLDMLLLGPGPTSPLESPVFLSPDRYSSEQEFTDDLKNMWFGLYSRGNGEVDSSGFEHVFSGGILWLGKEALEGRRGSAEGRISWPLESAAKPAGQEGHIPSQAWGRA